MNRYPSLPHSGLAKAVWFIGLAVAMVGGAIFAYGVISFIADVARAMGEEEPTAPNMDPVIRGVTIGFPIFAAGGLLSLIASVVSPARHAPSGPTYNIHNPQGNFTWSGRDTNISGGQRVTINNVSQQIHLLQNELRNVRLQPHDYREARDALNSAQAEMHSENPDFEWIADRVEQFTEILERSGELYRAGQRVAGPLKQIAQLLRPYLTQGFIALVSSL